MTAPRPDRAPAPDRAPDHAPALALAACRLLMLAVLFLTGGGLLPAEEPTGGAGATADAGAATDEDRPRVTAGSKKFTEGVILGEIARHLAARAGAEAVHQDQLGGTQILWEALLGGDIDVYAEYTGTLYQQIFSGRGIETLPALRDALAEKGLAATAPLGFNNTYAIGMKEARAEALGIVTISDLREHPDLVLGFTAEFLNREDGWPNLKRRYNLPHTDPRGMDHDIAYRALDSGSIDVHDLYSTDAEIADYGLRVLEDDLVYFPKYEALFLYRRDLAERAPAVVNLLTAMEGMIPEEKMIRMNKRAKIDEVPETEVAADFIEQELGGTVAFTVHGMWRRIGRRTLEHLKLVGISMALAVLIAVPLGILAGKLVRSGQAILGVVGILQTIPALALLVLLVGPLGIGLPSAITALTIYSLLPIVRNTANGLATIPRPVMESALALGLRPGVRLWKVELPMALSTILTGIKTAVVLNIGFATLGALVGSGGYGQPILTGIRLNQYGTILMGAVPAAVMAVGAQVLFEGLDRILIPKPLRRLREG